MLREYIDIILLLHRSSRYLLVNRIPLGPAKCGHFELEKWPHEEGYPWNEEACKAAVI